MDLDSTFAACVKQPEASLNLAQAALLLGRDAYPELDVTLELQRLDSMAQAVRARLPDAAEIKTMLLTLNDYLFHELGFSGNSDDYYDPRNSFLNEVLSRKLGIPVTLSVVYLEIGWRLGLQLQGVGFPGHFLVKAELEDGVAVLDPFFNGRTLDMDDLIQRLQVFVSSHKPTHRDVERCLSSIGKRDMLARILRNLRNIYWQEQDLSRALTMSNRLLAAAPRSAVDTRDRGKLLEELECPRAAVSDYQQYLQLFANAEDRGQIQERISILKTQTSRLN